MSIWIEIATYITCYGLTHFILSYPYESHRNVVCFINGTGGIPTMHVHANEFEYEGSLSTGEILKKVESPIDKLQAFTDILKNCDQSEKTNLTIYIGDSVGDLLCLLEADIGIVIGSSSSLRRIASHFGVSFVPLFPALVKKQKELVEGNSFSWKGLSGVLYTVSSWAEVHSFTIGSS